MIITIVGGGSTFTPGIVKSIALRKEELEVDEIRLFDIDKERQDKLGVLVKWILEEDLKSDIKLTVTYDEKEAYTDADFIFAQMRVGKYAMRELDEKNPSEAWLCRPGDLRLRRNGLWNAYDLPYDQGDR